MQEPIWMDWELEAMDQAQYEIQDAQNLVIWSMTHKQRWNQVHAELTGTEIPQTE